MAFSKRFPRNVPGVSYPIWEEITLTSAEEQDAEQQCRQHNFLLLDEALHKAKALAIKHGINTEETVAALAVALFEKEASHAVFWKEMKAKEKIKTIYKHV